MILDHGYISGKKHVIGTWLYVMEGSILLDRGYMKGRVHVIGTWLYEGKGACYWTMVI